MPTGIKGPRNAAERCRAETKSHGNHTILSREYCPTYATSRRERERARIEGRLLKVDAKRLPAEPVKVAVVVQVEQWPAEKQGAHVSPRPVADGPLAECRRGVVAGLRAHGVKMAGDRGCL